MPFATTYDTHSERVTRSGVSVKPEPLNIVKLSELDHSEGMNAVKRRRNKYGLFLRILQNVENFGNRLPDPVTIFVILVGLIILLSKIFWSLGASVEHPLTKQPVAVQNLLSGPYLQKLFTEAINNFAHFPPLGMVLAVMIGIGVAEKSGLFAAAFRGFVRRVPPWLLSASLVFLGINSSIAVDSGYVILIPLGALVYAQAGRHPIAGLAATFAGVGAGFSANLFVTSLDPLLSGITTQAIKIVDPEASVSPTANYYFMVVSTILLTIVGAFVTNKIVEPRLGEWNPEDGAGTSPDNTKSTRPERRALLAAGATFFGLCALVVALVYPRDSFFRSPEGDLTPFYHGLVALLMIVFLITGIVYGVLVGKIRSDKDVVKLANETMAGLGSYIVLVFVAAQFIALFNWSNLGIFTAVKGAAFLKTSGFTGIPLLVFFIVLTAVIDLLMGSASAKWALMAPIFVPMFALVNTDPAAVQGAYRIGDSVANILTPLLYYYPLILVACRRYDQRIGVGSLLALMLPYSLIFLFFWTLLFGVWLKLGYPLGF
jgi:aminobenzoyl-glutamate transport protein